ncbi:unnamed protein product [Heligmosomoides polygyrus]|uniref:Protein singed wings 2 n=1 Tax=Heligmosomoides polygyrus TaxID=6339 RepID=A0A3P8CXV6_HELPZ|nr:unnamed protein product [Heligmosomoides polygyrus]
MIRAQFLKLEGCELTDRDIFNVPEINCKVKYLCLRDNKFTKPWQLIEIRFPLVEHLDMKRNNRISVELNGNSYERNKLEHCTGIDVDEWDYGWDFITVEGQSKRKHCNKYVNGVKLEQIMGTQDAAPTTRAGEEGCTSVRENQMEPVDCAQISFLAWPLSCWILVVTLRSHKQEVDISILPRLATALKHLWFKLSAWPSSFKLHVLLDQAIGEDLQRYGIPNHWSSAGFESNHRRMQLGIALSTTQYEG